MIIKLDFDLDIILIDKKSDKNILIYFDILISYKTLIGSKPLQIRFDNIDGIIRMYDMILLMTKLDILKV